MDIFINCSLQDCKFLLDESRSDGEEDDDEDECCELTLVVWFCSYCESCSELNKIPMLPFSPILYETSLGSTHIVSSLGNTVLSAESLIPQN